MTTITLFTSGSTKEPKEVSYSYADMKLAIYRSIYELKLTDKDIVLDVFPHNTIAHYTVTALPAYLSKAKCISAVFNPYTYLQLVNKYKPTYIALVPRHYELLKLTKEWATIDLSSVRYMVLGSGKISQDIIDDFKSKGVKTVANWYGMTEMPPPVFVGYDSESFDFTPKDDYTVEFTDEGECVVNGFYTGDIFDLDTKTFSHRKEHVNGTTWKNNF